MTRLTDVEAIRAKRDQQCTKKMLAARSRAGKKGGVVSQAIRRRIKEIAL